MDFGSALLEQVGEGGIGVFAVFVGFKGLERRVGHIIPVGQVAGFRLSSAVGWAGVAVITYCG